MFMYMYSVHTSVSLSLWLFYRVWAIVLPKEGSLQFQVWLPVTCSLHHITDL